MIVVSPPWGMGIFTHQSVKWRRFPIARRPSSPLGWTATSAQCRHELTDFTAMVTADHARRPFNPIGALTALGMMQAGVTRRNKRQGWRLDGTEITA